MEFAATDEGVSLPAATITPVYRSDGSGTTSVFTAYLSQVSEGWKSGPGAGASVRWPIGQGGKGNEGVAALVKQVPNAIGYVEYAYAKQNSIPFAQLRRQERQVRRAGIQRPSRLQPPVQVPGNQLPATGFRSRMAGDKPWPITAPTFILVPKKPQERPEQVAEALKFFDWAFKSGDQMASELDYVPLPAQVKDAVRATWASDIKDKSGQAVFKK